MVRRGRYPLAALANEEKIPADSMLFADSKLLDKAGAFTAMHMQYCSYISLSSSTNFDPRLLLKVPSLRGKEGGNQKVVYGCQQHCFIQWRANTDSSRSAINSLTSKFTAAFKQQNSGAVLATYRVGN